MGQTDHSKEISEVWTGIYGENQPYSFKINILASYVKVWSNVAVLHLPVARTCSYRHRTVVMVTGRSSRKHTGPRYPKSFNLMRCLLNSDTRSLLRILYKTWRNGKEPACLISRHQEEAASESQ